MAENRAGLPRGIASRASRRSTILDDSCAGDESLRREVNSLLAHHGHAGDFIETPAFATAKPTPGPEPDLFNNCKNTAPCRSRSHRAPPPVGGSRRRRYGRRLSCRGHEARTPGRTEVPARRVSQIQLRWNVSAEMRVQLRLSTIPLFAPSTKSTRRTPVRSSPWNSSKVRRFGA